MRGLVTAGRAFGKDATAVNLGSRIAWEAAQLFYGLGPICPSLMPGRLHQQTAGLGVAGPGNRALHPRSAARVLTRCQTQVGPIVEPVNRCQSPIWVASPTRSAGSPPADTQAAHDRGELAISCHRLDRSIQPVRAGHGKSGPPHDRRRTQPQPGPGQCSGLTARPGVIPVSYTHLTLPTKRIV